MLSVIYVDLGVVRHRQLEKLLQSEFRISDVNSGFALIELLNTKINFDLVVFYGSLGDEETRLAVQKTIPYLIRLHKPSVLISEKFTFSEKKFAVREGMSSIYEVTDVDSPQFVAELTKVAENPPMRFIKTEEKFEIESHEAFRYKPRLGKRLFDLLVSGMVLLIFSPVYLLLALLIRLESKGPIFYISKRVGAGYQIFDFYKFRTMVPDADSKLKQLSHLNQYATQPAEVAFENDLPEFVRCAECMAEIKECENLLYDDTGMPMCEKVFLAQKRGAKDTFFKLTNDPRVTKLGKFLRNSSLDEIPQLLNVFKGDMSIVGNRPLPLYEAEKLTKDMFAKRFLAPAGLTGLWQVTKRGKGGPMSEEERISLDNTYADHYGFWFDIKLILKTIPALFQKENV